jgi:hypothetical protein
MLLQSAWLNDAEDGISTLVPNLGMPKDGHNKFTSHNARFSLTFSYWTRMMSYTLFYHGVTFITNRNQLRNGGAVEVAVPDAFPRQFTGALQVKSARGPVDMHWSKLCQNHNLL